MGLSVNINPPSILHLSDGMHVSFSEPPNFSMDDKERGVRKPVRIGQPEGVQVPG